MKGSRKKDPSIEPESRWEDGYIESFNGKPNDERLGLSEGF
jgi:hypothetical protein